MGLRTASFGQSTKTLRSLYFILSALFLANFLRSVIGGKLLCNFVQKLLKLIKQNFCVWKLKSSWEQNLFEKYLKTNCVCHNITRQTLQDKFRTIVDCVFREIYKCCAILKSFAKNWHFRKLILILIHIDNIHRKSQRISLVF